jgi:hypothetical protein
MAHAAELQFCQCQVRVLLNVRGMFFHIFPNANGIISPQPERNIGRVQKWGEHPYSY